MPKAPREVKKPRARKEKLVDQIRAAADEYKYAVVFQHGNARSSFMFKVRMQFKSTGRFFMGGLRVMQVALGRTPEDAIRPGFDKLAAKLKGHVGLMFANADRDELVERLRSISEEDFAHAGAVARETVRLEAGDLDIHPAVEPRLRTELGLPTELKGGVVKLLADQNVCKEGDTLDATQCAILRQFGYKLAEFRLKPIAILETKGGELAEL